MTVLPELVSAAAARVPERVAVEDPERNVEIDYSALDQLTDDLSKLFTERGVGPGSRVGICAPKSIGTVVSIIATLKAGAAYVPVDPTAPSERNAFILKDCMVQAIVSDRDLAEGLRQAYGTSGLGAATDLDRLNSYGVDLVLLGTGDGDRASLDFQYPNDLAYILYTSGSTGKPKGVMHTHASALSFVDWCSEIFSPTPEDKFSSHAPFHFDLSILDLYLPLKHGAGVVLIGESLGQLPVRLAELISNRGITMWYSTPSILRLLVEFGKMEVMDFSALRVVNFAGEVFPVKHLRSLQQVWSGPRYFNLYGPTETNVCTYFEVPGKVETGRTEPYPIGYVCSGDKAKVVDLHGREVSRGEEGELYVTGGSVMAGYWNLPERNAEAFSTDDAGSKWYKTGDIVRDSGDGCYLYIGRRDRMVKRRGYRVELGEIESALYRHPAITEAAVIAVPDEENGVMIKAFMTWNDSAKPSIVQLKQFCVRVLPKYMIPDRFSVQTSLPKTSTDKIDYQVLGQLES